MTIWNCHNNAAERHNLNNPRQTNCSLEVGNQPDNSVSERRDFLYMPKANNKANNNINDYPHLP